MKAAQDHARDLQKKLWEIEPGIGFVIINRADKSTWKLDIPKYVSPQKRAKLKQVIDDYEHSQSPNDQ